MKVKLLKRLRNEAMGLLNSLSVRQDVNSYWVCGISYPTDLSWLDELLYFTVDLQLAKKYHVTWVTRPFFDIIFRCRVLRLLWKRDEQMVARYRHRYRKYTRKWKSLHGKKLGIRAEREW